MRQRTTGLLLLLLLLPTLALASGNDIFILFFVLVGHVFFFLGGLLVVRMPAGQKAVLAAVYLLTLGAACYGTGRLPYTQHLLFINWTIALAPVLVTVATWLLRRAQKV